jgi:hypothetical protein
MLYWLYNIRSGEKNNNKENVKRQYTNYNQSQLREFEDPKGIIKNINSKKGQIIPQPKEDE